MAFQRKYFACRSQHCFSCLGFKSLRLALHEKANLKSAPNRSSRSEPRETEASQHRRHGATVFCNFSATVNCLGERLWCDLFVLLLAFWGGNFQLSLSEATPSFPALSLVISSGSLFLPLSFTGGRYTKSSDGGGGQDPVNS